MNTSKLSSWLILTAMVALSACTVSRDAAPPLQGPSSLGQSLFITANPDVLSMDGASQSQITIEARDANGQLKPNLALRAEIIANGAFVDFGSLSARTLVTGANGRATVTYTAPIASSGSIPTIDIQITPAGTDTNGPFNFGQYVEIRLVPPGVIIGSGPTAKFTFTPPAPTAFQDVRFDASTSTAGLGAAITSFNWNFGDGSTATGVAPTHRYSSASTFHVVLTVTDSNGQSGSTSQDIAIGGGTAPTAEFTFSPSSPALNQDVNFNGGLSTASAGHTLVRYDWNFGSGLNQSGVTVTKAYDTAGSYSVVLTVTDEVGQIGQRTQQVTVAQPPDPVARFTFSPTSPAVTGATNNVTFDAFTSSATSGATLVNYRWNFGDGTAPIAGGKTAPAPGGGTYESPRHLFIAAGSYNVSLTVTDSNGKTGTTVVTVTVGT